jgi:hypothetical protein
MPIRKVAPLLSVGPKRQIHRFFGQIEPLAKLGFRLRLHSAVRVKAASDFIPAQPTNSVGIAKLTFCNWLKLIIQ